MCRHDLDVVHQGLDLGAIDQFLAFFCVILGAAIHYPVTEQLYFIFYYFGQCSKKVVGNIFYYKTKDLGVACS